MEKPPNERPVAEELYEAVEARAAAKGKDTFSVLPDVVRNNARFGEAVLANFAGREVKK